MRRLTTFACEGETLAASLDDAGGTTGVLLVIGGSQTRIGSHRMYERLAKALAEKGFPCFRYDRRGVGDSSGDDPGFRGSGPDIAAAAAAFRAESPALDRIDRLRPLRRRQRARPVRRRSRAGRPDPRQSLAGRDGGGGFAAAGGHPPPLLEPADEPRRLEENPHRRSELAEIAQRRSQGGRANGPSAAGDRHRRRRCGPPRLPAYLILAEGDATAIAAEAELKAAAFDGLIAGRETLDTDSHTFARPGDEAALLAAVERALAALAPQAS